MPNIHLITFGGGGRRFEGSARRVVRQAAGFRDITSTKAFFPKDLDDGYHSMFPNFADRYPRGFGLWAWKPYLIHRELQNLDDGEILFYADGGCELNSEATERFNDYLKWIEQHDVLLFQMEHKNKNYTKSDPRLIPNEAFANAGQYAATIVFIRKSAKTTAFVEDWLTMCAENDGELLKDVDPATQPDAFIDHRHDQSVLNAAACRHGIPALPDETFFPDPSPLALRSYARKMIKFPVISMRNKSGVGFMPLIKLISRL